MSVDFDDAFREDFCIENRHLCLIVSVHYI